jgi:CDP-diacylglycerol--glycerol-3-phosphate 3-phosphatidyltransferase
MMAENKATSNEVSPWNLPNAITAVRILLVPVFVYVLFAHPDKADFGRWLAVLVFVVTISTDGLDGAIARKRGLVTNVGKILDPIADKALIGGALVALSVLDEVYWWVTVTILVREVGITVYRFAVIRRKIVSASGGGKLKTILQSIAVGFLLSPFDYYFGTGMFIFEQILLYAAYAITMFTGAQYLIASSKARD